MDGSNPVKLIANGGDGQYSWNITGKLPAGLRLDKETGVISGTPTKVGVYPLTVKVMDGLKAATALKLNLTVQ
jgi:large repetitive protein